MKLPWGKKDDVQEIDEYKEVPMELEEGRHVKIMIERLENYAGVDSVIRKVREGNIVIVKIKELKEANLDELKQAIAKMKTASVNFDGDIAGVGDEWIILTPRIARIERDEAA